MEIRSVFDPAFKPYGRVVEGYPVDGLLAALKTTPLPDAVAYTPREEALHAAADAQAVGEALFGGMPFQLGWCNGHNTRLNCLEYHRDSEFNLGTEAFILLLAKQDEMENGVLDTAKVRAFRVPAGVLIEVYATTLHYAPCSAKKGAGFRVLIVLPLGTNGPRPEISPKNEEDRRLWACNKWLLAHRESSEAAQGAPVLLEGVNLDIGELLP